MKRIIYLLSCASIALFSFVAQAKSITTTTATTTATATVEAPIFRAAYGAAVVFAGDDLIISENSGFSTPGMVHIIRRGANGMWDEVQTLEGDNAIQGDGFGSTLAADENTLFVTRYSRKAS